MFRLRSLGYVGEGVQREIGRGGGLVSCGAVQPGLLLVMGKACGGGALGFPSRLLLTCAGCPLTVTR